MLPIELDAEQLSDAQTCVRTRGLPTFAKRGGRSERLVLPSCLAALALLLGLDP